MKNNNLTQTLMQIAQLNKSVENKDIEIDLDQNGQIRSLTTTSRGGLQRLFLSSSISQFKAKAIDEIDAFFIAHEFINSPVIKDDLQSANMELEIGDIKAFAFGYRVSCEQMAKYTDKEMLLSVHGGAVHIAINKAGEIFSLTSTLHYGQVQSQSKILSKTEAIKLARANYKSAITAAYAQLMLVAKDGQLVPAYEITLVCQQTGKRYICIVLAGNGKIIERRKRIQRYCQSNIRNTGSASLAPTRNTTLRQSIAALIKARALLNTPNPAKPISEQARQVIVEHLPNPQVLRNAYLDMFTGKNMNMVYADADGTFCYGSSHAEFAAVSVFLSLANQIELYLQSGMAQPGQALAVVVNDSGLKDNAYFDPLRYEMHLGVGRGVEYGGLTRHIAYDLGVANHEFGHVVVHWQTVAGELAGAQGEAINEAIGDVLGTLVMNYLSQIWYASELGHKLTRRDLRNDARVIGTYALPPFGIRTQKNDRRIPGDITGEPHADGLIIGGALADILIDMATQPGTSIEGQIRLFVKIVLMALALLPGYKVMFTDMRRALITADQQIAAGQYRSMIEACFEKHGITVDTMPGDYRS